MRLLFIKCIFCLVLFGCTEKNKNREDYDILEVKDTVSFKLDEQTSYRTYFIQSITDSTNRQRLLFLSQHKPSIQIFDIDSKEKIKEIPLEKDGPNSVGNVDGLLYRTLDSIYVISGSRYKVSLINSRGQVVKSYRVLEGSNYSDETGMLRPHTTSPAVMIGTKIYFNVAPDRDVYKPSYFEGKVNLALDLITGEYNYFNNFPSEFKGGVWGVAAVSYSTAYNFKTQNFIYSYAISDSIFTYNPISEKRASYYAGSEAAKGKAVSMNKPDNSYDLEYALQTMYYSTIIYDIYKDVYYRFVRHPIPYIDEQTGKANKFEEKPLSIIVMDSKFKILGEKYLSNNTFLDYIYYITPEGLYISNANPENQNLNEDYASFIGFELKQK